MTNEAFKNWGCLNGHSQKTRDEFSKASTLHREAKTKNPEDHVMTDTTPYRCYHVTKCSCGFGYSCDSSD